MRKRTSRRTRAQKLPAIIDRLLVSDQQTPTFDRTRIGLEHHLALHAVVAGRAQDADMGTLAEALNMATALAASGVGAEAASAFDLAREALDDACASNHETGHWMLNATAQMTIGEALVLHDEQLKLATVQDLRNAAADVRALANVGAVTRAPGLTP